MGEHRGLSAGLGNASLSPKWGLQGHGTWAWVHLIGLVEIEIWPARSKLRAGSRGPGEGPGFIDLYSGGDCVRLASQSNENLPLPAVEG
ncbi:hypothetical protein CRG98_024170 [Punica granatum]|uniref:Uncharacterized protein n=1 Tax=Punica granatum TaxID=22663 RepID=A0A2I0JGR3_PUNGR|nr:hypothetical protein CRG98_024170 [Punica granatum]